MHVAGARLDSASLGVGGAAPTVWAGEAPQARVGEQARWQLLLLSGHPLSVVSAFWTTELISVLLLHNLQCSLWC